MIEHIGVDDADIISKPVLEIQVIAPGLFLSQARVSGDCILIIILLTGIEHPPMSDLTAPLDKTRRAMGWVCLAIFVLSFTPIPMSDEPPGGAPVSEAAGEEPERAHAVP